MTDEIKWFADPDAVIVFPVGEARRVAQRITEIAATVNEGGGS